jgi:hypothetical protein
VSAEITVGSTLGGRYLVTAEVVTTAEGDMVFDGTDQVLNRPVSLLVAAPTNATRMAVSAREIAMGTRPSEVQVLDLGLNADSTYLIANLCDPTSLLDLVVEADAPYIEPFQTDTLGQEIFGEPRSLEPQVYDDDAEYYQELAAEQQRRPLLGRLFGKRAETAGDAAEEASPATAPTPLVDPFSPEAAGPAGYASVADAGNAAPATGPFAAAPQSAADAARAARAVPQATEQTPTAPAAPAGPAAPAAPVNPAAAAADDATRPSAIVPPVSPLPPVSAPQAQTPAVTELPSLSTDEQAARAAAERGAEARAASRFPREAASAAGAAGVADGARDASGAQAPLAGPAAGGGTGAAAKQSSIAAAADDVLARVGGQAAPAREEADAHRWTRLLVGVVLVAVLVTGVVLAVKALGGGGAQPVAQPSSSATSPAPGSSSGESGGGSSTAATVTKPKIDSIAIVAPSESDWGSLYVPAQTSPENAVDGNASTRFSTYTYKSANFGNYFKEFTLMVKLKQPSDLSSVTLTGLGGTGGEVQVAVGDSASVDSAKDVFSGSFSGSTLEAPTVNGGDPVKGQYVFITVSELPRLASPNSPDRPYGFQVSEIKVS